MAHSIRIDDDLYEYIKSKALGDATISDTIKSLIGVEELKGRYVPKKSSPRFKRIPQEIYSYLILSHFTETTPDIMAHSTEIQATLSAFFNKWNVFDIYTMEAEVVSRRAHWKIRYQSTLRYLEEHGFLAVHDVKAGGALRSRGTKLYYRSPAGEALINDMTIQVTEGGKELYLAHVWDTRTPLTDDDLGMLGRRKRGPGALTYEKRFPDIGKRDESFNSIYTRINQYISNDDTFDAVTEDFKARARRTRVVPEEVPRVVGDPTEIIRDSKTRYD